MHAPTRFLALLLPFLLAAAPAATVAPVAPADAPVLLPPEKDRWVNPPTRQSPLLAHRTFESRVMKTEVGYNIYLPPGYASNKDARYPVLYWLHGLDQSESTNQYPVDILDNAIKTSAITPMIVVYASGGQRTYYTDDPATGSLPETMIIKELIPHIDATYRTNARREQRAIAGMSMGGFGALKFAFKYPDLFSSVSSFAPGVRDPQSFARERPDILLYRFKNDPALYNANHPATLAKENLDKIKGRLPIVIHCGDKDYLIPGNRALHQALTDLKIEHTYQEYPGVKHNLVKLAELVKDGPFQLAAKNFK